MSLHLRFDECGQTMSTLIDIKRLPSGRHFECEVIGLCVRWYLRYKPSLRDSVEVMLGRDLSSMHSTIMNWVRRFAPGSVKRCDRLAKSAGRSWRVGETL